MLTRNDILRKPIGGGDDTGRQVIRWPWAGLCFAVPFVDPGLGAYRDVITRARPTVTGTITPARDMYASPVQSQPGSAANYLDYAHSRWHERPFDQLTVLVRFKWNGVGIAGDALVGKIGNIATDSLWSIEMGSGGVGITGSVMPSTTLFTTGETVALSTSLYSNVFLRWRTTEPAWLDVYNDKSQLVANAGSSTVTGSFRASTQPLRIFGSHLASGIGGNIAQVLVWSRKLTDTECKRLSIDPYIWLRKPFIALGQLFPAPEPNSSAEVEMSEAMGV